MASKLANYDCDCEECMTFIAQNDPVWFGADGEKLCESCARKQDRICPQCQGSKRSGYDVCFGCVQKDRRSSPGLHGMKGKFVK